MLVTLSSLPHYTYSTIVQIPFLGIGTNRVVLGAGVPYRSGSRDCGWGWSK